MRTTSIALPPAFMFSRCAIASPLWTRPAIMSPSNPWTSTRSSSVAPCGSVASSSSASRCSGPRRCFRGGDDIQNSAHHFLRFTSSITLLDCWPPMPPGTAPTPQIRQPTTDAASSPHAFRRPCTVHACASAAVAPASAQWVPVAVAVPAPDRRGDHVCLACPKLRTERERNQETVIRFRQQNLCSFVGLMT